MQSIGMPIREKLWYAIGILRRSKSFVPKVIFFSQSAHLNTNPLLTALDSINIHFYVALTQARKNSQILLHPCTFEKDY